MTQRQLPLPLETAPAAYERADFLVGASNAAALEEIDRWPDWPNRMLFLSGPEGSGKTHLGQIWRRMSGAGQARGSALTVEAVPGLLAPGALLVDAADEITDEPALFHLINHARECGASLLLLSRKPPEQFGASRPDLASRLCAMARASLLPPDDELLACLLAKRLSDRQLGPVPAEVVRYMVERIERSHEAVERAARALDEESLGRPKGLSIAAARAALARL
jgi:chromosomal replication initiation ATPase DnaA